MSDIAKVADDDFQRKLLSKSFVAQCEKLFLISRFVLGAVNMGSTKLKHASGT